MGIDLKRAVFLDRDGTLNPEIFYADTQAHESPRTPQELTLLPGAAEALLRLQQAGFLLFLVSNQPNVAKGKNTSAELAAIHGRLEQLLAASGVTLTESFYCYHHPDYTGPCPCRKPSPHFLLQAQARYNLDMVHSWMIGDRDSDIECGRRAGVRTLRAGGSMTLASVAEEVMRYL